MRACATCGVSIEHRKPQARYCSRPCVRRKRVYAIGRACLHCGENISHRGASARYCGYACRLAANPPRALTDAQRARLTETQTIWTRKWKAAALAALGGKCCHCGFDDERALQFDHVHGDGHKDLRRSDAVGRRQRKSHALGTYYKRIAENAEPGRFQLLCANCNWIKRAENNEHLSSLKVV